MYVARLNWNLVVCSDQVRNGVMIGDNVHGSLHTDVSLQVSFGGLCGEQMPIP